MSTFRWGNNQRCTILVNETLAKPIEVPTVMSSLETSCVVWHITWKTPKWFTTEIYRVFRDSECKVWGLKCFGDFCFVHIWHHITCKAYLNLIDFSLILVEPFFYFPKVVSFNTEYGYDKMYINGRPFSCSLYHFCCPPFPAIVAHEGL